MTWIYYAVATSVALAVADICVKLAAGKISNSVGVFIYGLCTFVTGAVWVAWERWRGEPQVAEFNGVVPAIGVGIAFVSVTIGLYATFGAGAPVSVASPVIRLSGLLLASVAGFLFFREALTWRYLLGMVCVLFGIYLILTR